MPQCLQQYLGSFFCHDITTLRHFNAANSEMFRVNTFVNFLFFSVGEKINKQLKLTEEIHSLPSLKLSKHEIVWKPHTTFLNRVRGDSKKIRSHKSVLCTKRENWYYLKYNCYRPLRRECVHESELKNGLYHAGNARAHASYILCSTTRKST